MIIDKYAHMHLSQVRDIATSVDSFWALQVVGLDLVDDESKPERRPTKNHMPTPEQWTNAFNPAFSYYAYYCYANLFTLNKVIISSSPSSIFSIFLREVMVLFNFQLRESKGMTTIKFRPHAGEVKSIPGPLWKYRSCLL